MPPPRLSLDRAGTGDEAAFAEFFDGTVGLAHKLALMVVGDAEEAADVVRRSYVEAWRRCREQPEAGLGPTAWLLRIVQANARAVAT